MIWVGCSKQGLMHDLFTRGVDENGHLRPPCAEAPQLYKESEWGWIPREWEARRLGDIPEYLRHEEDVVIGMDRTFTKAGMKISVLTREDCPSLLVQRVGRFFPTACDQNFLRVLLGYGRYHADLIKQQKGMDIPHLSQAEIVAPHVPVPRIPAQQEIARRLLCLARWRVAERNRMKKLRLLKLALMQDLLTGKVRVDGGEAV